MRNFYNFFLGFLIFVCLVLIILNNVSIHANVTEGSTPSNVTVQKSLAIDFSTNLSDGIRFGTVNVLPATDVNASHNYDGLDNGSSMFVIVSNDSNTNVDLCIRANGGMTSSGADVIGLGNETYSNNVTTNMTVPEVSDQTSLTTSFVKSGSNLGIGSQDYYRFWLDVPGAQPSGDYTNIVYFKGIQTGSGC